VCADEKPDHLIFALPHAHRAVRIVHTHRPQRQRMVQPFELQTRVMRVLPEAAVRDSGSLLDVTRQSREVPSE
jgi:hypothetical protein